jgi:hypothetical protein
MLSAIYVLIYVLHFYAHQSKICITRRLVLYSDSCSRQNDVSNNVYIATPSPAAAAQAAMGRQQAEQQGEQTEQSHDQQQQQPQPQHPLPQTNGTWPFMEGRTGYIHTDTGIPQSSAFPAGIPPPPPPPPPPPFGATLSILQAMAAQNSATPSSVPSSLLGYSPNLQNFVPLIPLGSNKHSDKHADEQLPETLTDEQLQSLSTNTREAIEERLRILEMVQAQTFRSIQILSQVLSVLPDDSNFTESITQNKSQDEKRPDESSLSEATPIISERRREKMPMDTQISESTSNNHINNVNNNQEHEISPSHLAPANSEEPLKTEKEESEQVNVPNVSTLDSIKDDKLE